VLHSATVITGVVIGPEKDVESAVSLVLQSQGKFSHDLVVFSYF